MEKLITEIPGMIAVCVVDINSGMSLASHSNVPSFDPDIASAFNAEVIRQKQKAMAALRLTNETIEDILITLTNQIHILKLVGNGNYFLYVAANSKEVNLGIARSVIRRYAAEIVI
jgi:predicted regulator of Ras-like GTPase activity (Roadblock/LC7/MglB family)